MNDDDKTFSVGQIFSAIKEMGPIEMPVLIEDSEQNLYHIKRIQLVEETGAVHILIGEEVQY